MRTRQTHILDQTTISALTTRRNGFSLRRLAAELGLPERDNAMLSNVLNGKPGALTLTGENDLRQRLGLPLITRYEVPACPDCGLVHTGRCHGKPVAAVAVLGPGEKIAQAPKTSKPRRRYHRPCLTDAEYAEFLAWRAERRGKR